MTVDARPQLWLLAGANGAGKSTFYRQRLESHRVEFINADLIEKTLDQTTPSASYTAAGMARERVQRLIEQERSFCYETVFSHSSKLDLLEQAKASGYQVNLVFIHLRSPELNLLRVTQRVSENGHPVPPEKILSRIPRTLVNMQQAVRRADRSLLFDNSSHDDPFRLVADKRGDRVTVSINPLPLWAQQILMPPQER